MKTITKEFFNKLIAGTDVIEKDGHGLKVLETQNGRMIKIFRRKRFFSTALFKPYALRFVKNADKLHALNIPTVHIDSVSNCPDIKRQIIVYKKLAGELLRDTFEQNSDTKKLSRLFGKFVAQLHAKGVYFRSIHLKNILVLGNGELGLIDISDMQIKRNALSLRLCLRNFQHMLRYPQDKEIIKDNFDDFLDAYAQQAALKGSQKNIVKARLLELIS